MKKIDFELVLMCAVIAVVMAFSIIVWGVAFVGVRFSECNSTFLVGAGCTLGGILWGILLISNSHKLAKSV